MTQAAGVFVGRTPPAGLSRRRRSLTLAAVVAAHALALVALLGGPPPQFVRDPPRSLVTFDVRPFTPPRPEPPAVRPPPEPPVKRKLEEPLAGGASPRRPIPEERARDIAPASSFEATIVESAPPLPPPLPDGGRGIAAIDLGGAGGTGDGTGAGDGSGSGDAAGGRPRWARAEWIERPSHRLFARHWPERAKANRISGSVLLACIVPRPGRPERCEVIEETPAGQDFGAAAIRMSSVFRIRPVRRNGKLQPDMPVIVPVVFKDRGKFPVP